jgi:hypothetical protein
MTVGENTADIAGIAMMLLNDQNGTGHYELVLLQINAACLLLKKYGE